MTLLQQANKALRDQNYEAAWALYLKLLQQERLPTSTVVSSLRILQIRLQGLSNPTQEAMLQQISAVLAQPTASQTQAALSGMPVPTPKLADQASQARDSVLAAQRWEQILQQPNPALDADTLVRASQALFKADNFPLAHQALQQALAKAPEHAGAKREHKNQYYYHAYSVWLMQTTEGRGDWYKADGLSERPNWKTAVDLCRPYINKPRGAIAAHDLRQWTQAGLLCAEEHWYRQDHARAITILRETLAPLTANCPPELTPALIETIETARATPEADRSAPSQRLQEALSGLDADILTVPEWLCLYDLLNWNGLLQLGYLAREHAIQRALRQADAEDADSDSLQQGARAALDQGELDRAGRYLARLPEEVQKTAAAAELRAVQALFAGDLEAFRQQWPHPPHPVDKRFREYLRGKSVAVVGPAPTGSADGAEIDGFDVVVRMNWRGPVSLPEAAEFGRKTHVALYNAHTVRLLSAEGRLGLVKALDFCLIRRARYDLDRLPWEAGRVRNLVEYPGGFYKSLNAVPALLFDLLLHGADRIRLYKVNFYLGERHHARGYRGPTDGELSANPLRRLQPVMGNHDLVGQINFFRGTSGSYLHHLQSLDHKLPENYLEEIQSGITTIAQRFSNPYWDLRTPEAIKNIEEWKAQHTYNKSLRTYRQNLFRSSADYKRLLQLKNKHKGKRCFILGNGPSLQNQRLDLLRDEITFVTNWFVNSEEYERIKPTYYCVSSHEMFGGWGKADPKLNADFYNLMQQKAKHTTKFFSFTFRDYINSGNLFPGEEVNYLLFERPKQHVDEVGDLSLDLGMQLDDGYTVILSMCIPLAVHMGFDEIILLGCDCDYGIKNEGDKKKYFYKSELHKTSTSKFESLQRIWADEGPLFKSYEIVNRKLLSLGIRFINATHGGKLEKLQRIQYEKLFYKTSVISTTQRDEYAFATVLNNRFVPGFVSLLCSLQEVHPDITHPFIVFYNEKLSPLSNVNKQLISSLYPYIVFRHADEKRYNYIWLESAKKLKTPEKLKPAFFILEAFSLTEFQKVITLDSDMLIVGSITCLFDLDVKFSACQAIDYDKAINRPFVNTGVMVLGKESLSESAYNAFLNHKISESFVKGTGKADQAIINDFHKFGSYICLDEKYNVTKRKYPDDKSFSIANISNDDIRVIHYVGEKPWKRHEAEFEKNYKKIESLWHQKFFSYYRNNFEDMMPLLFPD